MSILLSTLTLAFFSWSGAAFAADENPCMKMNGQERAACESQHAMGQEKMHEKMQEKMKEKGMSEGMRGQGAKEKGKGAAVGNADHENHGAKSKAKF